MSDLCLHRTNIVVQISNETELFDEENSLDSVPRIIMRGREGNEQSTTKPPQPIVF